MACKLDVKRMYPELYCPGTPGIVEVDVPAMRFVKVDGSGDPNTSKDYADAVKALYAVSYAMKFDAKRQLARDYVVPPLEGLWWADDPAAFAKRRKGEWHWTMMIHVPDPVTETMFQAARDKVSDRKGPLPPSMRHELYPEGRALQTLHVGSYDAEGPTLAALHSAEMPQRGLTFNGPHHEIYLSDPRRTAPEKLKTVLRQPVKPIS